MGLIKVRNAYKAYQSESSSNAVLQNFNMNVMPGTIYSLMGASGCGKTTLISCLIGVLELDSGNIEIFGEPPRKNKSRIGYMPQDAALVNEFSVREMIWFFGTIYGLSSDVIDERFKSLSDLLELPPDDRFVRNCSGGQQRRISFALSLIHQPDILILDEPTVGVDPLLRAKIWDFLVDLATNQNVTVLLSTHYIEEARQSTHVGIMRNGVQVAEGSPQMILERLETTSLEEAFLRLSRRQESDSLPQMTLTQEDSSEIDHQSSQPSTSSLEMPSTHSKQAKPKQTTRKIMKALIVKNFLQLFRNFSIVFVAVVAPIFTGLPLHYGVGGKITGLTLGIVNNEMPFEGCANSSLITTEVDGYDCYLNKVSCRFVDAINDDIAFKKYFDRYEDAYDAVKKGHIIGFIQLSQNFTQHLPYFNDLVEGDWTENGIVQVYLDNTDMQKTTLIKRNIYEAYNEFIENLMVDCNKQKKAGSMSIVFETLYGELDFNFRETTVSGYIYSVCFAFGSFILATAIVSERAGGIWNRALASGVKANHFFGAHLLEGILILLIQSIQFAAYVIFFLLPHKTFNSIILLSSMCLLSGVAGLTFGLFCSIILKTVMASFFVSQFAIFPVLFICGVMWPIEGVQTFLRYISYIFPFSLPIAAFRSILMKDSTICDQIVYTAFMIVCSWIVFFTALSFWLLREKKSVAKHPVTRTLPLTSNKEEQKKV